MQKPSNSSLPIILFFQRIPVALILNVKEYVIVVEQSPQPAFTCSKLTIETREQGVKYVQS